MTQNFSSAERKELSRHSPEGKKENLLQLKQALKDD
jgi:hypothetical protein